MMLVKHSYLFFGLSQAFLSTLPGVSIQNEDKSDSVCKLAEDTLVNKILSLSNGDIDSVVANCDIGDTINDDAYCYFSCASGYAMYDHENGMLNTRPTTTKVKAECKDTSTTPIEWRFRYSSGKDNRCLKDLSVKILSDYEVSQVGDALFTSVENARNAYASLQTQYLRKFHLSAPVSEDQTDSVCNLNEDVIFDKILQLANGNVDAVIYQDNPNCVFSTDSINDNEECNFKCAEGFTLYENEDGDLRQRSLITDAECRDTSSTPIRWRFRYGSKDDNRCLKTEYDVVLNDEQLGQVKPRVDKCLTGDFWLCINQNSYPIRLASIVYPG